MINKNMNYLDDMTDRYIFQVSKYLPSKNSKDIEEELRTLISDMLEDRMQSDSPSKKDIDSVLKELGNPYHLAAKYNSDKAQYLIGPAIFHTYLLVLKIVMCSTFLGLSIVAMSRVLTSYGIIGYKYAGKLVPWYEYTGNWIADIVNSLLASFALVTIIFGIMEKRKVVLKNKSSKKWIPSSLPPIPVNENLISIRKSTASIILLLVIMIISIFSPQILGAYSLSNTAKVIPIFNLKVFHKVLPLFLICIALGLAKNIWKIIERKISKRYAVFNVITNFIIVSVLIFILTNFSIWNLEFIEKINTLFHLEHTVNAIKISKDLTNYCLVPFIVALYLINSIFTVYKVIKDDVHHK